MLLIGNSFPLSLIRRRVVVEPCPLADLTARLADGEAIASFWGHANTLAAAETLTGRSLKPATERPTLALSPDGLPTLQGHSFRECWILSPDYSENFRPKIGEEVPAEKIRSWQVLRMEWETNTP